MSNIYIYISCNAEKIVSLESLENNLEEKRSPLACSINLQFGVSFSTAVKTENTIQSKASKSEVLANFLRRGLRQIPLDGKAPLAPQCAPCYWGSDIVHKACSLFSLLRCCLGAAEKKMAVVCINPDISCQAVSRLGRSPWLQGYGAPPLAGRHTLSGEARFRRGGKQFEKTVLGALASWSHVPHC